MCSQRGNVPVGVSNDGVVHKALGGVGLNVLDPPVQRRQLDSRPLNLRHQTLLISNASHACTAVLSMSQADK